MFKREWPLLAFGNGVFVLSFLFMKKVLFMNVVVGLTVNKGMAHFMLYCLSISVLVIFAFNAWFLLRIIYQNKSQVKS
ncbi:hypothetical protein [Bacillus sp. 1P06AnD]|uniref:hypothetical protein n=1 Tax=Bacillus sp. 1P06AnD TaxID=3132208 RepID=UPI0039A0E1C9